MIPGLYLYRMSILFVTQKTPIICGKKIFFGDSVKKDLAIYM